MKLADDGLRIVLFGATGALGSEVLAVLDERGFAVGEIVPVATDRSLGVDVEFRGELIPVETETPPLRGADLVLLCAPASASLGLAAEALRQRAAAFDLSGALSEREEVPLLVAGVHQPVEQLSSPVIATPPGPALSWLRVLVPLHRRLGLRRIVATALESAAGGGRGGIESLSSETVALFNQRQPPEPGPFGRPVAFDCVPQVGEPGRGGETESERQTQAALARVLGSDVRIAVTAVQVPTFCGVGTSLALETERSATPQEVVDLLRKAEGIAVGLPEDAPSTRTCAGTDLVHVGRVRSDPSSDGGLLLWLAADPLRVAATNAVRLAEARLRTH